MTSSGSPNIHPTVLKTSSLAQEDTLMLDAPLVKEPVTMNGAAPCPVSVAVSAPLDAPPASLLVPQVPVAPVQKAEVATAAEKLVSAETESVPAPATVVAPAVAPSVVPVAVPVATPVFATPVPVATPVAAPVAPMSTVVPVASPAAVPAAATVETVENKEFSAPLPPVPATPMGPPAVPHENAAPSLTPAPTPMLEQQTPVSAINSIAPPPSANNAAQDAQLLLQEQLRFCLTLIRHMKKRKDAFPFLLPVDPVLLNIPTYFDIIEKPMDMSTIEKKVVANTYKSIQEFRDDVHIMFANCYKFNGPEAQVSVMGQSLEKHFIKEMEKLPLEVSLLSQKFHSSRSKKRKRRLLGQSTLPLDT